MRDGLHNRVLPFLTALGLAMLASSEAFSDDTPAASAAQPSPEQKAVAFLSREVPAWRAENNCFSCHNNGDAIRALFLAVRLGEQVPPEILKETAGWLVRPEAWQHNGGETPFDDRQLAELQFAAALADGVAAKFIEDRKPLDTAAQMVARRQNADGSWSLKPNPAIGSPAIWPRMFATILARQTLAAAGKQPKLAASIEKADRWLAAQTPGSVVDAAGLLLAPADLVADSQRTAALALIEQGQSRDGGWGPFVSSPPEAFDTAIVLLALERQSAVSMDATRRTAWRERIERGRNFLIDAQLPEGSWQETTRPAGAESYAQRMSTAGWATMALLTTRKKSPVPPGKR